MRYYYDKLFKIMEERELNNEHLLIDAKIPMAVISQIYSGYNIDNQYVFMLQDYLGLKYTDFIDGKKDEEQLIPKEVKTRRRSEVYQLNKKTGMIINRFDSTRDAGRALGKEFSAIAKCANGERHTAYGFKWVWVEDYKEGVA